MKNRVLVLLLLALLTITLSLSGCGSNKIHFSLGTFEDFEKNTKLESDKPQTIVQKKEKIENSKLVFNKNNDDSFDNMYLCFSGNNIENVTATSRNKTILYDQYETISHRLELFEFYYKVDEAELDEYFDAERNFDIIWDSGQLDSIKNVYFNGMDTYDIKNNIGWINPVLYSYDELKYMNYKLDYLGENNTVKKPVVYVQIDINSEKEMPTDYRNTIVQSESVTTNSKNNTDGFIYRYEKLFYNSQMKALKYKNNFDYDKLSGETIDISVKYTDGSIQCCKIEISFDEIGNIIAKLR